MITLDDDIMQQLRATFKVEAEEHIQAMNRILVALEKTPSGDQRAEMMEEIFREAHSLKGAAGAADFGDVEAVGHRLESVLGSVKSGQVALTTDLADVLYESVDAVSVIIENALQERPHGLDLPDLFSRLDAAKEGRAVSHKAPAAAAVAEAPAPAASAAPQAAPEPEGLATAAATVQAAAAAAQAAEAAAQTAAAVEAQIAAAKPAPAALHAGGKPAKAEAKGSLDMLNPAPAKAAKAEERGEAKSSKSKASHDVGEDTIRVATSKLDALISQSGELMVAGLKIDQRLQDMEAVSETIDDWNREWLKLRATSSHLLRGTKYDEIRPVLRFLDLTQQRLKTLITQMGDLKRGFSRDALHLSRVTNDLGEGVMKVRMLPVSTVLDSFPRLVRDLAHSLGKEVELVVEGGETELDRKVLEEIKDPLIHLLRNAVDHGIELPDERAQAGKPRAGTITVSAFQKGNNIVIQVADDGGGINVVRIKEKAVKAGLLSADEAQTMTEDEAHRLIFAPGFSTRAVVTDVSGRGVGMDVVRRNVEALHGQVEVESELGTGSRMILTLPLTLATTQELLVQVEGQTYGLPISSVERIQRINRQDISTVEGREAVVIDNEPVSLVRLGDVLELEHHEVEEVKTEQKLPVVILGVGRKRIALLVDAVVGQQESVVKSLGKQLARVRNVAGATILGTGQVIMTLNPNDLMASVRMTEGGRASIAARTAQTQTQEIKRPSILVVDDSLTTRTLEKNILETAGFAVKTATDGAEALTMLQSNGGCDLIVSDVLMPRMNGLQLTQTIRSTPSLKDIPIVLVTSLESREDKERGIEVGANAYVVKSTFDQSNLLQAIEQLI